MASETGIVNIALHRIGVTRIDDLDTDTVHEAVVARDLYDEARDTVLRSHNWNFAAKREQLAQLATDPTFGWDYGYGLPSDWIRTIAVLAADDDDSNVPYRMETYNVSGTPTRAVLVNSNQVYMRFVYQVSDVTIMTPDFRDALSSRLAIDLARALPQSSAAADDLKGEYRMALNAAKSTDGIEDYPEPLPEGSWVTSRE